MNEGFRDFEHAGWTDPEVCAAYDHHLASLTTQSIGALLDAARVGAGSAVLDVATGAGYAAAAALDRGARVTGCGRLAFTAWDAPELRQRDANAGAIDEAILAALAPWRSGHGYEVPMPAVLAAATRPS